MFLGVTNIKSDDRSYARSKYEIKFVPRCDAALCKQRRSYIKHFRKFSEATNESFSNRASTNSLHVSRSDCESYAYETIIRIRDWCGVISVYKGIRQRAFLSLQNTYVCVVLLLSINFMNVISSMLISRSIKLIKKNYQFFDIKNF